MHLAQRETMKSSWLLGAIAPLMLSSIPTFALASSTETSSIRRCADAVLSSDAEITEVAGDRMIDFTIIRDETIGYVFFLNNRAYFQPVCMQSSRPENFCNDVVSLPGRRPFRIQTDLKRHRWGGLSRIDDDGIFGQANLSIHAALSRKPVEIADSELQELLHAGILKAATDAPTTETEILGDFNYNLRITHQHFRGHLGDLTLKQILEHTQALEAYNKGARDRVQLQNRLADAKDQLEKMDGYEIYWLRKGDRKKADEIVRMRRALSGRIERLDREDASLKASERRFLMNEERYPRLEKLNIARVLDFTRSKLLNAVKRLEACQGYASERPDLSSTLSTSLSNLRNHLDSSDWTEAALSQNANAALGYR
jgi:hypothetical protein